MSESLAKYMEGMHPADRARLTFTLDDFSKHLDREEFTFLDYGAGSGSISIGVMLAYPKAKGLLLDVADREDMESEIANTIADRARSVAWDDRHTISDERFDVVISTDVFEHVPNWKSAVRENLKHVSADGVFYVQTPSNYVSPNWPSYKIWINRMLGFVGCHFPSEHVRHGISCKSFVDLTASEGFEPVFAAESYTCNGVMSCSFKPRTHAMFRRATV